MNDEVTHQFLRGMKIHRATHGNRQYLAHSLCSIDQGVHLINFKIMHVFMDGFLSSQKHLPCHLSLIIRELFLFTSQC